MKTTMDDYMRPPQEEEKDERHYLLPTAAGQENNIHIDVEVPTQVGFHHAAEQQPIYNVNHDDDDSTMSPLTLTNLPTPPRRPGGAVYHMSTFHTPPTRRQQQRQQQQQQQQQETRPTVQQDGEPIYHPTPTQPQQPFRDIFQEEYDTNANQNFSNNYYNQQQPAFFRPTENRPNPGRPKRTQIQPEESYLEMPPQPLEYDEQKGYHIRNFQEYQQQNRNRNNNYSGNFTMPRIQPTTPNREDKKRHRQDEKNPEHEVGVDDNISYYTFLGMGKCSLMGLMVCSCTVGLVLALAALGAVMLWNEDIISSVASGFDGDGDGSAAPTISPAAKTNTNAITSSLSPTPSPLGVTVWQEYRGSSNGMGFGAKVAIRDNWVVVSAPNSNSMNAYRQDLVTGFWDASPPIMSNGGGDFGVDMHLGMISSSSSSPPQETAAPFLVVGAPGAGSTGNVFFYTSNTATGEWILQGGALQASGGLDAVSSKFGSSIAATDSLTVVVGAPEYGTNHVGRVFTFQLLFNSVIFQAQQIVQGTVSGSQSKGARFGNDVDISESGERLVVGEPGTSSCKIYTRQGLNQPWNLEFTLQLSNVQDLGESVVFLSSNVVAVGAPSAKDSAGLVIVLQRAATTTEPTWEEIGRIEGNAGERIGRKGTVSGATDSSLGTPQVVISTTSGSIRRYDWVNDQFFVERFEVDVQSSVSSIDISADEDGFVVLAGYSAQDFVALYGVVD